MKTRPVLGIATTLCAMLLPASALADDASDLRDQILKGCDLKAWQFNVRIEPGGAIIPQLSPTMIVGKRQCALKMIEDYRRDQTATS